MEKIPVTNKVEKVIDLERSAKQKFTKTFLNYSGILISIFLMFVVVLVLTTDVQFEIGNLANLGMDFFLLLSCSIAAYILCADSGTKDGALSSTYLDAKREFETWLDKITAMNVHCILGSFCAYYIKEDLRIARMSHLVVAGVTYEEYESIYSKMGDKDIDALKDRSEAQKNALKEANKVQPIKLLPEQITGVASGRKDRSPLSPEPTKMRRKFIYQRIVTTSIISLGMVLIGLNSIETSGWLVFVSICLKLGSVLFNCFNGYKTGYENMAVDSAEHMRQQVSLMKQAILFAEEHKSYEKSKDICTNAEGIGASDIVR